MMTMLRDYFRDPLFWRYTVVRWNHSDGRVSFHPTERERKKFARIHNINLEDGRVERSRDQFHAIWIRGRRLSGGVDWKGGVFLGQESVACKPRAGYLSRKTANA